MNDPQPPQTTNPTNELAKQRNRDAAERTLTAWIQNSLTLMGIGIALDEISMILHKAYPSLDLMISQQVALKLGLGLIAFSILLLVIAIWQHQIEVKLLDQDNYLFLSSRNLILASLIAVLLFGLVAGIITIFKSL